MTEEVYLDPKVIYADELQPWQELWNTEFSLYENVIHICQQSLALPRQQLQLPIAATYMLIPSKWAKVLPILFSCGDRGTGKTTFAILASKLHGLSQLFSAADTFASIRNALDTMRWIDQESKDFEKDSVLLAWDNIHKDTLIRDPRIYQMLLFGYNRNSERILIASSDGTNREYRVFCPKIISSVQPLHSYYEFEELKRRLLLICHKQYEKFTSQDREGLPEDFDINTNRIDLNSINWQGIEQEFFTFWNHEAICKQYARQRTTITRKGGKSWTLPSTITGEKWTICIDLIVTGLCVGTWQTVQGAIDHLAEYFEWVESISGLFKTNTFYLIQEWLDEKFKIAKQNKLIMLKNNIPTQPLSFQTRELKEFLNFKQTEGCVDINLNKKDEVKEIMRELGWRMAGMYWVEIE
jgi:hypothetical protein